MCRPAAGEETGGERGGGVRKRRGFVVLVIKFGSKNVMWGFLRRCERRLNSPIESTHILYYSTHVYGYITV